MTTRPLTYQEFATWTRNHDLQRDADRREIAELKAAIRLLTEALAGHIGAERIAEIAGERRVA